MKISSLVVVAAVSLLLFLYSFTVTPSGTIRGTVNPVEATGQVWAMSGGDTVKTDLSNGTFVLANVKSGTYRVVVDAADPYKDAVKEGVAVQDGQTSDVGEIKLEK